MLKFIEDCPIGTKFYSPLWGNVTLQYVHLDEEYPITVVSENGTSIRISADGTRGVFEGPESVIQPTHSYVPFEKVIVRSINDAYPKWCTDIFSHYDEGHPDVHYVCVGAIWEECLPYNEETAKLIGTTNEYGTV